MPRARGRKTKKTPKATSPPPKKRTRITEEAKCAIHQLFNMGMQQKDVATAFKRCPSAISKLLSRSSHQSTSKARLAGRPKLLTPRNVRALKRIADAAPHASYDSYGRKISAVVGKRIAPRTTGTYLRREGILCYRTLKKPRITARQMSARLAWAREHVAWPKEAWRTVIFSDETMLILRSQTHNTW